MAGEVKNPQRALPLALVGGVAIVGALYMLTNAAIQYVPPSRGHRHSRSPAADAMRLVAGHFGPRSYPSLGHQHLRNVRRRSLPARASPSPLHATASSPLHSLASSRFHTPSSSLILQAVLSSLLILAIGKIPGALSLAIFSEWPLLRTTAATVFVFRAPGEARCKRPETAPLNQLVSTRVAAPSRLHLQLERRGPLHRARGGRKTKTVAAVSA